MNFWGWVLIAIGMAAAFGVGWIVGDDRGRNLTNRQWIDKDEWKHITRIGGAGAWLKTKEDL